MKPKHNVETVTHNIQSMLGLTNNSKFKMKIRKKYKKNQDQQVFMDLDDWGRAKIGDVILHNI